MQFGERCVRFGRGKRRQDRQRPDNLNGREIGGVIIDRLEMRRAKIVAVTQGDSNHRDTEDTEENQ